MEKSKKAIIIGATSGIGRELAKLLSENNYIVGITGRRTELLNELKTENPNSYFIKTVDITDLKQTEKSLNELTKEIGGLDLLILSSGIGDINENLDFEIEKRTINTNVLGFTCITNWAFNLFEKQKSGHLVAISSVGGLRGSRHAPAYNATKSFQMNYLEGLRQKAKKLNSDISVTDIRPGFVNTEMAKGDGLFWVAPVEKASRQIFSAINRKKKVAYVTKRWRFIASILKHLPRPIYDKM
ncbi:MAG TPA: SDR family NAD(P)-dependent oxidoreductase [Bacteroidaceae bacterium]|nr:SDR family NAD(P)-dependent oxidoreductase [Bacteroidaceae bacterium]